MTLGIIVSHFLTGQQRSDCPIYFLPYQPAEFGKAERGHGKQNLRSPFEVRTRRQFLIADFPPACPDSSFQLAKIVDAIFFVRANDGDKPSFQPSVIGGKMVVCHKKEVASFQLLRKRQVQPVELLLNNPVRAVVLLGFQFF